MIVGDSVYWIMGDEVFEDRVNGFQYDQVDCGLRLSLSIGAPVIELINDRIFFTKEKAERRLEELRNACNKL